jgi:ectoine hydroxylase-related dioxygenase (phytanoyl-CoA dioxygenase family)
LRRCDAQHGSLLVYTGSHQFGLVDHGLDEKHVQVSEETRRRLAACPARIVEADPGDVVFMNSLCIHESSPNSTDAIKINGQFFYNDALAVQFKDEYQALKAIPDYKAL